MKQGLSQEGLKGIACLTMLIDHVGAVIVYGLYLSAWNAGDYALSNALVPVYNGMRIIGRIAFPIFCFLLVEGVHYTRNPKKYALRLAIGVLLSELPFDLALNGGLDWTSNSVMITLVLGFGMLEGMKRVKGLWKIAMVLPFYVLAELLKTDYAGHGILFIAMLALTRGIPYEKLWRTAGFGVLLWFGATISFGPVEVPMEIFGLVSLIPIFCYSGKKLTRNKAVQWGFYLFYPAHLLVIWIIHTLIFA